MNDKEKLIAYTQILNEEIPEFRIVEELSMILANQRFDSRELSNRLSSPQGKQRMGYLCDVATDLCETFGIKDNAGLSLLRLQMKLYVDDNYNSLSDAYFTSNHDLTDVHLTHESSRWKVISGFSAKDIQKKYKLKYANNS